MVIGLANQKKIRLISIEKVWEKLLHKFEKMATFTHLPTIETHTKQVFT